MSDLIRAASETPDLRTAARPVLQELAASPETVEPTQHVLGFVHCRLGEEAGRVVRLHIWLRPPLEPAPPPWMIHNHLWDIHSHLLCGALEDYRFDVTDSASGDRQLYEVKYDSNTTSRRVRLDRRVECRRAVVERHSAGESYVIPRGAFHTTEASQDSVLATLVITSPATDEPPLVVGAIDGDEEYVYERQEYPRKEFVEAVRTVLEGMVAGGQHGRPPTSWMTRWRRAGK